MVLVIVGLYGIVAYLAFEPQKRNRHPSRPGLDARADRQAGAPRQPMDAGGRNRHRPAARRGCDAGGTRAPLRALADGWWNGGRRDVSARGGRGSCRRSSRVARGTCPSRRRDALRVSRDALLSECDVYDLLARAARPRALSVPGSTKNGPPESRAAESPRIGDAVKCERLPGETTMVERLSRRHLCDHCRTYVNSGIAAD